MSEGATHVTAKVYPRACGGTSCTACHRTSELGLSPRLRGNRFRTALSVSRYGSIPALAGEPHVSRLHSAPFSVYPRACGGTSSMCLFISLQSGLSPRLRGNFLPTLSIITAVRSIPALAGEPTRELLERLETAVYPRACGGTKCDGAEVRLVAGLSPRLRGNHYYIHKYALRIGSIPALAGEPMALRLVCWGHWVYPRACGGTMEQGLVAPWVLGLSPRLRGNPRFVVSADAGPGSIPALAGEPPVGETTFVTMGVYPRACGGTGVRNRAPTARRGLSPRLRGNLKEAQLPA